jgi:hypothetical protein
MARLLFSNYSLDELTTKIQKSNCVALFKSDSSNAHPAWSWNPAKLKLCSLEFIVADERLSYARAFVLQVKREMRQPE